MSDYLPYAVPGKALPRLQATAVITGGQLVGTDGAPCAAGSLIWLGVAAQDTAIGQGTAVHMEGIQRLTASAAIAQGARVKCAANGQIVTYVDGTDPVPQLVGLALDAAAGAASVIRVKMAR